MIRPLALAMTLATTGITPALAADLVERKSQHTVAETIDRLEAGVTAAGATVFARIDHAAGAKKVNADLRPTEVLIFGTPQGGTPFMECAQSVGIDLPLKALVWEDASAQVWVGYNDPAWIAKRHAVESCPVAGNIAKALAAITEAAVAK